jgi:hypothetical protein
MQLSGDSNVAMVGPCIVKKSLIVQASKSFSSCVDIGSVTKSSQALGCWVISESCEVEIE